MSTAGSSGQDAAAIAGNSGSESDTMKRAAAKNLIERYYRQLTEGCGASSCGNPNCFSSGQIKSMTRNEAAAAALQLFKTKGRVCDLAESPDHHAYKVPRPAPSRLQESNAPNSSASVYEMDHDQANILPPLESNPASVPEGPVAKSDKAASAPRKTKKASENPLLNQLISSKRDPPTLNEEKLLSILESCRGTGNFSLMIRTIGETFNNPESLVNSFRKKISFDHLSKEDRSALEGDKDKDTDELMDTGETIPSEAEASGLGAAGGAARTIPRDESSLETLAASKSAAISEDELSLDLESLRRCYESMFGRNKELPFIDALVSALFCLAGDVEIDLHYRNAYERDKNYLNIFVIIFELPCLHSPEFLETALPKFVRATGYLPLEGQAKLCRYWSKYEPKQLRSILETMQQLITVRIISGSFAVNSAAHSVNDDDGITGATKVIKLVYFASLFGGTKDSVKTIEEEKQMAASEGSAAALFQELFGGQDSPSTTGVKRESDSFEDPLTKVLGVRPIDCYEPLLPFSEFINEPLNDNLEMDKDYMYYKQRDSQPEKFSFLLHPFILTAATKNLGMYFSNRIRMINERRTSLLQSLVHGEPTNPYLRLKVRRSHLIDDALVGLEMVAMENPGDLKKQLYVEFDGEQGIDEGGVSKEFFQLVVEEIFNPDFGMFVYNDDTHQFWFNPTCFESDAQFTLIGIVLGLAIYNNVILDVHFPMVVYRKLLGKRGSLHDLKDSHPVLYRSLDDLLSYEGEDVAETFMMTFRISYQDVFGSVLTHDLVEDGDAVPVTKSNRQEFVDLYSDFLLNKSVEKQFRAFRRGFIMVTNESPLSMLFRPEEVLLLVCGNKDFDWGALEDATDYDGGYTKQSETIKIFWDVFHKEFDEEQKRRFLQFTTGSDRAPIGGLGKLRLVVARNGSDSDRLPTSHTCFNVLLLPDYKNKEKLKECLTKAISYAKGFGML